MDALIVRLKAEFLEMPGLKLTEAQARRLWALDEAACARALDSLVRTQFLFRTRDGAFMRIERGGTSTPRTAPPAAI